MNMNKFVHLDYFGVPLNGTLEEFINALEEANLYKESELEKISRQIHPSIDMHYLGNGILGNAEFLSFVQLNDKGLVRGLIGSNNGKFKLTEIEREIDTIKNHYGEPTVQRSDYLSWEFKNGGICIIIVPTIGVCIEFTDNINSQL